MASADFRERRDERTRDRKRRSHDLTGRVSGHGPFASFPVFGYAVNCEAPTTSESRALRGGMRGDAQLRHLRRATSLDRNFPRRKAGWFDSVPG